MEGATTTRVSKRERKPVERYSPDTGTWTATATGTWTDDDHDDHGRTERKIAKPKPRAPKGKTKKQEQQEEEEEEPRELRLVDLPFDILEDIVAQLGLVHLISIVRLASTCRTLRAAIGAIAPWKSALTKNTEPDAGAVAATASTSAAAGAAVVKRKRRPDRVDPADVKKKGWWKLLAKYGPRLCLACSTLQKSKRDILTFTCPTVLVDLISWTLPEADSEQADNLPVRWNVTDQDQDKEEPMSTTALCSTCRQDLFGCALLLAGDEYDAIPGCRELIDAGRGYWINKGESEKQYRLQGELGGLGYTVAHIGLGRYDVVEYRYDLDQIIQRAFQVHGGPWGLAAIQARMKKDRKRRRKLKREKKRAKIVEGGVVGGGEGGVQIESEEESSEEEEEDGSEEE